MLLAQTSVGDVTPGLELEDAIKVFHSFRDHEILAAEHGVVAFDLELSSEQPAWQGEKPVILVRKEVEEVFVDPYNHESFSRGLEVNLRNRARSFKKVILEDIKFGKKANIALFKKVNIPGDNSNIPKWIEFDKNDLELNVKIYKA